MQAGVPLHLRKADAVQVVFILISCDERDVWDHFRAQLGGSEFLKPARIRIAVPLDVGERTVPLSALFLYF